MTVVPTTDDGFTQNSLGARIHASSHSASFAPFFHSIRLPSFLSFPCSSISIYYSVRLLGTICRPNSFNLSGFWDCLHFCLKFTWNYCFIIAHCLLIYLFYLCICLVTPLFYDFVMPSLSLLLICCASYHYAWCNCNCN